MSAVFNETVNIVEVDEGLDGETFFLYVFLAALCVLVLVAGQQFLAGFGRRKRGRHPAVERGTADNGGVDYDWLPQSALQSECPTSNTFQSCDRLVLQPMLYSDLFIKYSTNAFLEPLWFGK